MNVIGKGDREMIICYDAVLKDHLRVFDDENKALIKSYIVAAGEYIERTIGYPILNTEVEIMQIADGVCLELPKSVNAVTKVEKRDTTTWTEITPTNPLLDNFNVYKLYYADNIEDGFRYRITATLDYEIPELLKHAAFLLVGEMFENRENRPEKYKMKVDYLLNSTTIFL